MILQDFPQGVSPVFGMWVISFSRIKLLIGEGGLAAGLPKEFVHPARGTCINILLESHVFVGHL